MSCRLDYEFGPFHLDVAERLLRRGEEEVSLTLKAFEILALLVKNGGRIIAKEELLNTVWPNTFVEEATLAQNIFILRRRLGKDATGRSYIETIQRRGYRFVAPVRVVQMENVPAVDNGLRSVKPRAGMSSFVGEENRFNAIAILALENASGDPYLDYLGEGISQSIINNLSRLPSVHVMSPSSVFQYKGKNIDPQEVGRRLGVPTILSGKILRVDRHLIIRVELVDVQHGWQLWGDQYNEECAELAEFSDIFKIQQQVAKQVTHRLHAKMVSPTRKQMQTAPKRRKVRWGY
jgi:DNA-binding winged helix-turn-helix (wHTH) protein